MSVPLLYTYRCGNCKTVAVASIKAVYGQPWRCNLCHWPMTFLHDKPITTNEERAWAKQGIHYNPGLVRDPPTRCDNAPCVHTVGLLYGVRLSGVGNFCSKACADAGVAKHEAAMMPPELGETGEDEPVVPEACGRCGQWPTARGCGCDDYDDPFIEKEQQP